MSGWAAAWAAAPQRPGESFAPNWSREGFADQAIRQTVRLSIGGGDLRVRLTNRYGAVPLRVAALTVAGPAGGAAIEAGTLRELTVDGKPAFAVPAGADLASDPVPFPVDPLGSVTVTLHLAEPSGAATYHAQALATTYRAPAAHGADTGGAAFAETSQSWYYLSAIEVHGGASTGIAVLGDSLVDGTGSTPDTNRRFTDLLAERLAAAGLPRAVLNLGIGGNRVTVDSPALGERTAARLEPDVLGLPGVGTVMVLAGVNDIGIGELAAGSPFPVLAPYTDVPAEDVIAGHREIVARARRAGLRTVGVTLLPIRGSGFATPASEAKRAAVNAWIRGSGAYDAVVDLARTMGDALHADHDSGDHLHPNDAGYRAMAAGVDPAVL